VEVAEVEEEARVVGVVGVVVERSWVQSTI